MYGILNMLRWQKLEFLMLFSTSRAPRQLNDYCVSCITKRQNHNLELIRENENWHWDMRQFVFTKVWKWYIILEAIFLLTAENSITLFCTYNLVINILFCNSLEVAFNYEFHNSMIPEETYNHALCTIFLVLKYY